MINLRTLVLESESMLGATGTVADFSYAPLNEDDVA